jgi:hypothetical protein
MKANLTSDKSQEPSCGRTEGSQQRVVKPRRGWGKAFLQVGGVSWLIIAHDTSASADGWGIIRALICLMWAMVAFKFANEA